MLCVNASAQKVYRVKIRKLATLIPCAPLLDIVFLYVSCFFADDEIPFSKVILTLKFPHPIYLSGDSTNNNNNKIKGCHDNYKWLYNHIRTYMVFLLF